MIRVEEPLSRYKSGAKGRAEIQSLLHQPNEEIKRPETPQLVYGRDEHVSEASPPDKDSNTDSKRLFMDSGGQTHYIHLDGNGDRYHATAAEEAEWRKELLENYTQRIQEETDGVSLSLIVRNMQLNGAQNVEALLLKAAENASPKAKQGLAQTLLEVLNIKIES